MRRDIVHAGAGNLTYEIREIVAVGRQLGDLGVEVTWGEHRRSGPEGRSAARLDSPDRSRAGRRAGLMGVLRHGGCPATREFLAAKVNEAARVACRSRLPTSFSSTGSAMPSPRSTGSCAVRRVMLGPSPAYSTQSSAESESSGYKHLTYDLDPYNGWMPDLEDIRMKVKYDDSIAGILTAHARQPDGAVYPRALLEEIADIARQYDCFIITDEIYAPHRLRWRTPACQRVGRRRPGQSPCAASAKRYPWPGSRCGWIEVLNRRRATKIFHATATPCWPPTAGSLQHDTAADVHPHS